MPLLKTPKKNSSSGPFSQLLTCHCGFGDPLHDSSHCFVCVQEHALTTLVASQADGTLSASSGQQMKRTLVTSPGSGRVLFCVFAMTPLQYIMREIFLLLSH